MQIIVNVNDCSPINHSKDFWLEMDKNVINCKEKRSELRRYGLELY